MDKYNNRYIDTDIILNNKDHHGGYVALIQSRGYGMQKAIDDLNKKIGANKGVNKNGKK